MLLLFSDSFNRNPERAKSFIQSRFICVAKFINLTMFDTHEHISKDSNHAERLRNEGNYKYSQGKFYDALESYNQSLCFARTGSVLISMAYGNRSAVYFMAREFEKCLENIKLARDSNYPPDKLDQLIVREGKCRKFLKHRKLSVDSDPWNFFKLSYPPNEKLPFMANCLELRNDETYGRHIITKQSLKPGDIIVIEETPFKALEEFGTFIRCANCFKSNKMSLIPMDGCANGKESAQLFRVHLNVKSIGKLLFQQCFARRSVSITARTNTCAPLMRTSPSCRESCSSCWSFLMEI